MPEDGPDQDRIEILLSDDQKIKAVGEVLTNDSARAILQLLFDEELTANEISQRQDISLQLARYHLAKMQQAGMVRIARVGKGPKAHDMKYYGATRFAIVILPSGVSDRARESKSLIRSFKTIYRLAGVGVAAAAAGAGMFSLSFLQGRSPPTDGGTEHPPESAGTGTARPEDGTEPGSGRLGGGGGGADDRRGLLEEGLEVQRRRIGEGAEGGSGAESGGIPVPDGGDALLTAVIIAAVLGGLAAYFFIRAKRHTSPVRDEKLV